MSPLYEELRSAAARAQLELSLARYVPEKRWFRSKARTLERVAVERFLPLPAGDVDLALTVVRCVFARGEPEEYTLFLTTVDGPAGEAWARARPHLVVGPLDAAQAGPPRATRWIVDALGEPAGLRALWTLLARGARVNVDGCELSLRRIGGARLDADVAPRPVEAEQSNTSVVAGGVILKFFRKLEGGRSPELELGEVLTRNGYRNAPRLLACAELSRGSDEPSTIATAHEFVPNATDAWTHALAAISLAWRAGGATEIDPRSPTGSSTDTSFVEPLAARIAQMHAALAADTQDPSFAPEPILRPERAALGRALLACLARTEALAGERPDRLPPETTARLRRLLASARALGDRVARFESTEGAQKIRVHGDLHLGQVLVAQDDFFIVDFEGEPARPLAERRAKRSPLVDVAGMLRSLHYASVAAWRAAPPGASWARPLAEAWYTRAQRAFVRVYFEDPACQKTIPSDPASRAALLQFYLLEKCAYELEYEMNNRPDWIAIPLIGLERLVEDADAP